MKEINYKLKYQELKSKMMNAVDTSFRLGYQQGMQDALTEQAQQQTAQAQVDAQQSGGAQQDPTKPANPEKSDKSTSEETPTEDGSQENPNGSELKQHIDKLEGMVAKSEIPMPDLLKGLEILKKFGASQGIANLPDNSKKALTMQEQIVGDLFKKWDIEEKKASTSIKDTLAIHGFTKGE